MISKKCKKEHNGEYGSGRFCSSKCARSYSSENEKGKTKDAICILCGSKTTIPKRASLKYAKCEKCKPRKTIIKHEYCLYCGEKLSYQRKYCNVICQKKYEHTEYIKRWKDGLENGIKKPYFTSEHIKRYLKEKHNNKCTQCGWSEKNIYTGKIPLELDHIDGKWFNNDEKNLRLLCPNCHSLTKTYGILNKGNGRKKRKKYDKRRNSLVVKS